ncbi:MAG: glycosyltransferase family 39 protein [Candidatus Rokubacteria bacterium]|nr:glycosyltransferase family 39 protein [Candidatus Rokubacteria bacterium]
MSLGVALAVVLGYAATLSYDFVWDDTLLIQRSWHLHQWRSLPAVLGSHFWAEVQEASHYYRPLVMLSFFLDVQLWGLNPAGFHLTNVLAHLATSLAVLALGRRLTGSHWAGGIAGVAFALHPLHSESVAFISGRTDILATLFFLLALLSYAAWRDSGRHLQYALSLAAFFLALMAKEVAITLPAILVLYDRVAGGNSTSLRGRRRAALRYAGYGAVMILYAGLRLGALGRTLDADPDRWGNLGTRLLTTLDIVASYARLTVIPYPANAYPLIVPVTFPGSTGFWLAMALLAVALGLTAWALRHSPVLGFGALWFWITLLPFVGVNLLPLSTAIMAERFLYLPTVGFCLVLAMIFWRLLGSGALSASSQLRPAPALALAGTVLLYALLTLWRNEDWKDDYRLYSRMVEASPHAALPHVNLAYTQLPRGEIGAADAHLREAARLMPRNPRALVGLGLTRTLLGGPEAGLHYALEAQALAPRNFHILATLGSIYLYRDEPTRAVAHLEDSLRLNPHQVHATLNLALAFFRLERQSEAEAALVRAADLARLMSPGLPLVDRVTAEIHAGRDPARARAAWERYIARLRAAGELVPTQQADLAYAEGQLARLLGGGR